MHRNRTQNPEERPQLHAPPPPPPPPEADKSDTTDEPKRGAEWVDFYVRSK